MDLGNSQISNNLTASLAQQSDLEQHNRQLSTSQPRPSQIKKKKTNFTLASHCAKDKQKFSLLQTDTRLFKPTFSYHQRHLITGQDIEM